MGCEANQTCGGCLLRHLSLEEYRTQKLKSAYDVLEQNLGSLEGILDEPVFISDGLRRRATFGFKYQKHAVQIGFNENHSHQLVNIDHCLMLTPALNRILPVLRDFLRLFCAVQISQKLKGKKITLTSVKDGEVEILEAENGLDIVLKADLGLTLEHRMLIADLVAENTNIIRFSYRIGNQTNTETIIEKAKPFILIEGVRVFVAPGDFLQPSKAGEDALIKLVLEYAGDTKGLAADLFCGIGTFSYALAELQGLKVVAADINKALLAGFEQSVRTHMIHNIEIKEKNLFLYPFEADELKDFDLIVFDPPRAGAIKQVRCLGALATDDKPRKIIGVSCNLNTFARDAKILIEAGYVLKKLTVVDQFVYSAHSEVVALFTNQK